MKNYFQQLFSRTAGISTSASVVIFERDPTANDTNYNIAQLWINTLEESLWYLNNLTSFNGNLQANWIPFLTGENTIDAINVDASTSPGTDPVVADVNRTISMTGGQVAAGTTTNVIRTDSLAANSLTIEIQRSTTSASPTIGNNGVCHFDSDHFSVDSTGFVQLVGGGQAVDTFQVDVATAPGTNPVTPVAATGLITVTGAQIASGSTNNVIRTNTVAQNQYNIEVQRTTTSASTNANLNGVSHFSSASFSVDANGFVTLINPSAEITVNQQIFTSSGTYTPTSGMQYCIIECVGGGGGAGGSGDISSGLCAMGGGGGGGGYAKLPFSAAAVGVSKTVTIGLGGTGGSGGVSGNPGGTTEVVSLLSATGGSGGSSNSNRFTFAEGGNGGTGNVAGGQSGFRGYLTGQSTGMPISAHGGDGGNSIYGSGGRGAWGASNAGGTQNLHIDGESASIGYGGGGGGAVSCTNGGASGNGTGGNGANGIVIITEFIIT